MREVSAGVLIQAVGELDLVTAPTFREKCATAVTKLKELPEDQSLIVDFSKLEFIDSAGLESLISIWRDLEAIPRAHSIIVGKSSQPDRVFKIGQFHKILSIKTDTTESE